MGKCLRINDVGGTGVVGDIAAGSVGGTAIGVGIREEMVGDAIELLGIMNLKAGSGIQQITGLAEVLVVGTDDDGDAIDRTFGDIMDAYAEATAHHCQLTIAVDAGEESEAVDDEDICCGDILFGGCRIAQDMVAVECLLNGMKMVLANLMGCNDEAVDAALQIYRKVLAGEELTIDEYTVLFSNPRSYTLIQVKEDRFTGLALIGGLITMIGIFMALYLQQEKLWAMRQDDGKWTVYGSSRKGGVLFKEKFEEACGKNESKK